MDFVILIKHVLLLWDNMETFKKSLHQLPCIHFVTNLEPRAYFSFSFSSQGQAEDIENQEVEDTTGKDVPALVLTVLREKDEASTTKAKFPAKNGKQFLPVRIHFILYIYGEFYSKMALTFCRKALLKLGSVIFVQ